MPKRSWPGAVAGVSAIFSDRCWELAGSRTKFYWVLDLVRPSLRLEHIRSLFFWVENVTGIGDWLLHDCIGILEWLYQSILNHFDEKLFSTHLGWIVAPYLFFTDLFWMHTSSTSATCRKKLRSHCSKLLAKIRSVNRQAFLSLIERRCMFLLGISADEVCQSWQGYTRIVVLSLEWMTLIILIPWKLFFLFACSLSNWRQAWNPWCSGFWMVSFSLASQRRDRRAFAPVGEFFFFKSPRHKEQPTRRRSRVPEDYQRWVVT